MLTSWSLSAPIWKIIARYEPDRALETLPALLARPKDRDRLLTLLERVLADERVQRIQPSPEQTAMLACIRDVLGPQSRRRSSPALRGEAAGSQPQETMGP
jgi:hypothetical protein